MLFLKPLGIFLSGIVLALGGVHATTLGGGPGTINQLDPWTVSGSNIKLSSTTAGLRVPSLANQGCLGTDSNGVFGAGTCSGGGGGSGFATTSADYWKTVRNFFSTTSADWYVHSSTTIPKTYTSNTFGGTQTFSNTITGSVSGNAGTATALAANGANCSSGSFPLGVDASGAAENCTDAWLASEFTLPLSTANGGTGLSNPGGLSAGAVLNFNGAGGASTISAGGAGAVIVSNGSDWTPGSINLASANSVGVSILAVGNGGTGKATFSSSQLLYGNGTSALSSVATTTLTASAPLSLSQPITVIGPSASALSISTAGTWSGNAGTATALAANGANCSSGSAPLGVDASGAVESCFDVWTEAENTTAAYTPQSRTLTVAGTANQITSSAGAQDLTSNKTWTLSLPAHVIFPGNFQATNSTTTNATTTGSLYLSSLDCTSNANGGALTVDANHKVGCSDDNSSAGSGTGNVATSTSESTGNVAVWSSTAATPATLTSDANFAWTGNTLFLNSTDANENFINGKYNGNTRAALGYDASKFGQLLLSNASDVNVLTLTTAGASTIPGILSLASTTIGNGTPAGGLTVAGTATTTSLITTNATLGSGTGLALLTSGVVSAYGGAAACTNQVVTALSSVGGTTCASVSNAMLANSTISSVALGGTLGALTATDSTLTFSGSYTGAVARTVGINLGNANTWTSLQTINFASTTAITASGELVIPRDKTVTSFGEVTADDTTGQFRWFAGSAQRVLPPLFYASFTYSTSTAWTGTTTLPLGPAGIAETWQNVQCFTDTGTLNVSFYDGTNRMNLFNASTTVGKVTLSTNNSFTAGEKRYVDIGTPASTPTRIACTTGKTYDAD